MAWREQTLEILGVGYISAIHSGQYLIFLITSYTPVIKETDTYYKFSPVFPWWGFLTENRQQKQPVFSVYCRSLSCGGYLGNCIWNHLSDFTILRTFTCIYSLILTANPWGQTLSLPPWSQMRSLCDSGWLAESHTEPCLLQSRRSWFLQHMTSLTDRAWNNICVSLHFSHSILNLLSTRLSPSSTLFDNLTGVLGIILWRWNIFIEFK